MKLKNLLPLKEDSTGAFGATSEELADMYSLKMLQQFRDELMMDMENDPSVEPEGGPRADYYGGTLNGLDKAIAIKKGETKDVPYDVAIGRMSRDEFEKSSKFGKMQETSDYDMLRSFQKDELLDDLGDIIAKYVKDPDDVDRELDRFDDGGFDNMSNMVTANLLRDPEYKAWAKKFYSIKQEEKVSEVARYCESCGKVHEGTCGYTHTAGGRKLKTPGGTKGMPADKRTMTMMREAIRKEIRSLNENSDNKGYQAARKLIAKLREKTYRKFSDQELDAFSKEMALHFIDNAAAEAAIMVKRAKNMPDEYKPGTTDELPFE